MNLIVDTSVAIKWIFTEEYSEESLNLFQSLKNIDVPDLFFAEFGNVLWKRVNKGVINVDEAIASNKVLSCLPVPLIQHPTAPLLPAAIEIACQTGATVYDSIYIALAIREGTQCVTADQKLLRLIENTPLSAYVLWIDESSNLDK